MAAVGPGGPSTVARKITVRETVCAISMAAIGDTLTISVFIALIIGALCFYLFTRIKQVEKKVALMEGILLDLKTATENSFPDFPAPSTRLNEEEDEEEDEEPFIPMLAESSEIESDEVPFAGGVAHGDSAPAETRTIDLSELPAAEEAEDAASVPTVQVNKVAEGGAAADLEAKSVAELAAMARAKGISGTGKMRKQQLIEVLKASESITNVAPMEGPDGIDAKSSLIEGTSLLASPL